MDWNRRKKFKICHAEFAIERSSQSTAALKVQTTISDLNADCLLHVFEFMNPKDLCIVADVCSRFRKNAQVHFHHKYKDSYWLHCTVYNSQIEFRMLRNFGASIKKIHLDPHCGDSLHDMVNPYPLRKYYYENAFKLFQRFNCPTEMIFTQLDIMKNSSLMHPVLPHLQKISFENCKIGQELWKALLSLAQELQELRFKSSGNLFTLCTKYQPRVQTSQKFRKLETIIFEFLRVDNDCIEDFLKWNPQLKNIHLCFCENLDDRIFKFLAKNVPKIETILYRPNQPTSKSTIKYFGHLKNLKSLTLDRVVRKWIASALREIAAANTPLEYLELIEIAPDDDPDLFVDAISKMKNLQTLILRNVYNLSTRQMLDICKHLNKLCKFHVSKQDNETIFSTDHLLELLRNLGHLQSFCCQDLTRIIVKDKISINIETFEQIVHIVKNRCVDRQLEVCLGGPYYTVCIPDHLVRAHKDVVKLSLAEIHNCNGEH